MQICFTLFYCFLVKYHHTIYPQIKQKKELLLIEEMDYCMERLSEQHMVSLLDELMDLYSDNFDEFLLRLSDGMGVG